MAIDDREDGLWAVTRDTDGSVRQTNLFTRFEIVTKPGEEDQIKDKGARTAAQIHNAVCPPRKTP